jgi:hypothetical protein
MTAADPPGPVTSMTLAIVLNEVGLVPTEMASVAPCDSMVVWDILTAPY